MNPSMDKCRDEIVRACRRLDALGFVAATDGNVSVRYDADRILITPSMVSKGELSPSQLLVVDPEGRTACGQGRPSSEIGMHLHTYRARPDIIAVVHAHPPVATGFAAAGLDLCDPVLPEAVLTVGPVPLARYATPSTTEVADSIAPLIASHNAILLANHGVLTVGGTLTEALHRMERVEQLAKVVLVARMLNKPDILGKGDLAKLMDLFPPK